MSISRFALVLIAGGVTLALYQWDASPSVPDVNPDLAVMPAAPRSPAFPLPTASQYPVAAYTALRLFDIDTNGDLVITPDVAVKIDVLLADTPLHASLQEMQHVEEIAIAGLPPGASQEALIVLRGYRAYRNAEAELIQSATSESQTASGTMFERLIALRRLHLGTRTAGAMFGPEEQQARLDMEQSRVEISPEIQTPEQAPGME